MDSGEELRQLLRDGGEERLDTFPRAQEKGLDLFPVFFYQNDRRRYSGHYSGHSSGYGNGDSEDDCTNRCNRNPHDHENFLHDIEAVPEHGDKVGYGHHQAAYQERYAACGAVEEGRRACDRCLNACHSLGNEAGHLRELSGEYLCQRSRPASPQGEALNDLREGSCYSGYGGLSDVQDAP